MSKKTRANLNDHRSRTRFTNAFQLFAAHDENSDCERCPELEATNELITARIKQLAARSPLLLGSRRRDDVLRLRSAVHRLLSGLRGERLVSGRRLHVLDDRCRC